MKYMLLNYMNPAIWESLSEDEQTAVMNGHGEFAKVTQESGEFVAALAMADPSKSATVRVRDGKATTTPGAYIDSKEFLAGHYLVDVETEERAYELAALVPDAGWNLIEVRPVMYYAGQ